MPKSSDIPLCDMLMECDYCNVTSITTFVQTKKGGWNRNLCKTCLEEVGKPDQDYRVLVDSDGKSITYTDEEVENWGKLIG